MFCVQEKNAGPMANVTIPGGDFKRFAQFARRCLVSVGVGHANRAKGNAWELPKKFEGRVPLFLNRLMGLPVDQQKLVSDFYHFRMGNLVLTSCFVVYSSLRISWRRTRLRF